jgi:2'-5' RNA ligase
MPFAESPQPLRSRLLFMAQPPAAVRDVMQRTLAYWQLDQRLGGTLSPPANWHQTLSGRFFEGRSLLGPLRRAGERLQAEACTLLLNRIRGVDRNQADGRGSIHWSFLPRGEPTGFAALLAAVRNSLASEGLASPSGHTPHVTISYGAPSALGTQKITPIPWTIDEILLVEGHGPPYAYEVIERWPLQAAAPAQQQLDLL